MDNGPARAAGTALKVGSISELRARFHLLDYETLTIEHSLHFGVYFKMIIKSYQKDYGVFVDQVQAAGEDIGDMFEISTVRREDWDFIQVNLNQAIIPSNTQSI